MKERCDRAVMSERERIILEVIRQHEGRTNAIRAADLAQLAGLSVRATRAAVRRLTCTFGNPIGSATRNPPGFYFCVEATELATAEERWRRFGVAAIVKAVKLNPLRHSAIIGQAMLEITAELA